MGRLAKLVDLAQPKRDAKYVKFTSFFDPANCPGQRSNELPWPYAEGLTIEEARNELAFIAVGLYGKALRNQNAAPLRFLIPWKYGFKSAKSLAKIEFVAEQPRTLWNQLAPNEYGFYANVNPNVDHPRWSQKSERVIGAGFFAGKQPTSCLTAPKIGSSGRIRTYDQSVNPDCVGTLPLSYAFVLNQTIPDQTCRFPALNFALASHCV